MTGEHNVSGRSSAYGDNGPDSIPPIGGIGVNQAQRSETNSVGVPAAFTVSHRFPHCVRPWHYCFLFNRHFVYPVSIMIAITIMSTYICFSDLFPSITVFTFHSSRSSIHSPPPPSDIYICVYIRPFVCSCKFFFFSR